MAYELRDGGGTIFKNEFKKDGDNAPNMRGKVKWRGEEIEIALWTKDGAKGKFFSAKLQEPRDKVPSAPPPTPKRPINDDMDDAIPFAPEFR